MGVIGLWKRTPGPVIPALDHAPGPSPWYMYEDRPHVPGVKWTRAGSSPKTAGVVVLTGPQGVVLLLDFHNYVLPIDDDALLIWHQQSGEPTPPVVLRVFSLSSLRPLEGDLEYLCERMRHAGAPLLAAVPPRQELAIPTTMCCGQQHLDFPAELRSIQELLILCHSSAVEESPPCDRSNLALVVASPRHGTYRLYPQDWFNHARLDYAYQGVTRVARDPESGRIHGDGFRIDPFVLDRTLRNTR